MHVATPAINRWQHKHVRVTDNVVETGYTPCQIKDLVNFVRNACSLKNTRKRLLLRRWRICQSGNVENATAVHLITLKCNKLQFWYNYASSKTIACKTLSKSETRAADMRLRNTHVTAQFSGAADYRPYNLYSHTETIRLSTFIQL